MRRKIERIYRVYQFCFNRANRAFSFWVEWSYYLVNVNSIVMIYTCIRFYSEFKDPFVIVLIVTILLEIVAASAYLYQLCVNVRRRSQECAESHLMHAVPSVGNGETQFWRACHPMEVYVGGQFTISSRIFCLDVFFNLILQKAISLILIRF